MITSHNSFDVQGKSSDSSQRVVIFRQKRTNWHVSFLIYLKRSSYWMHREHQNQWSKSCLGSLEKELPQMRQQASTNSWQMASICRRCRYQDTQLMCSHATLRYSRTWVAPGRTPQEGGRCGRQKGLLPLEQKLLSMERHDQSAKLWWTFRVQAREATGMLSAILRW